MTPIIEVEHLSKSYGETVAVEDVSFDVARGEIFGILGRNGNGKTTTVEMIQGLRTADGGRVRVLGIDPQHDPRRLRPRIGSQLQESALPPRIKVWEAIDLFSSFTPRGGDWRKVLKQWGLTGKEKASFTSLSGGERQRLFVALALVNEPEVVFLDEMTQGLDPVARRVAWDLIREVRERGTTVILVTHYMEEAEQLGDRLAIMNDGRVVAIGSPQELIARSGRATKVHFSTGDRDVSWLSEIEPVSAVTQHDGQAQVTGSGSVLALVASALVSHGIIPSDLRAERPSLEDVFLELTDSAPADLAAPAIATKAATAGRRAA